MSPVSEAGIFQGGRIQPNFPVEKLVTETNGMFKEDLK